MVDKLTHLKQLEAESIHIIREVAAEFDNPVMLYSIGKDSAVMLHLARKAFFPGKLPFPVMHVDTQWKFQEMYSFRDKMVEEMGLELITHVNPEGVAQGINPFTHGSSKHTDIMKTQGLKQALDKHGFDAAFGGARRDEEKSRAKERVYSFRDSKHRGTRRTSARSCGTSTTARSTRASRFASSRCRTGPSWTSGSTSTSKASRSCRFTSPPSVKSSRRTAP
jgi:sulfate adenylyltransferase subunit 2 (EC 2.7.7.4)